MSDLQQRYGTTSPTRRRTLVVVSSLVAALFLGWLAWVIVDQSDPAARVEVSAYEVLDDQSVRIRIQAKFRDDQVQGSCTFGTTAESHSPAGDTTLSFDEIRAAGNSWVVIRTLERATTVEKKSCTTD
ncbi:MAG: DUF4307 domain-containing protein [Propionibacteriales bacterium]|nr:DUF4307 domain-containing protein [Propionibacteriales bacterium]